MVWLHHRVAARPTEAQPSSTTGCAISALPPPAQVAVRRLGPSAGPSAGERPPPATGPGGVPADERAGVNNGVNVSCLLFWRKGSAPSPCAGGAAPFRVAPTLSNMDAVVSHPPRTGRAAMPWGLWEASLYLWIHTRLFWSANRKKQRNDRLPE